MSIFNGFPSLNFWVCRYCRVTNPINAKKCQACGEPYSSEPIEEED